VEARKSFELLSTQVKGKKKNKEKVKMNQYVYLVGTMDYYYFRAIQATYSIHDSQQPREYQCRCPKYHYHFISSKPKQ
jgi:hypothetical protein